MMNPFPTIDNAWKEIKAKSTAKYEQYLLQNQKKYTHLDMTFCAPKYKLVSRV